MLLTEVNVVDKGSRKAQDGQKRTRIGKVRCTVVPSLTQEDLTHLEYRQKCLRAPNSVK